MKFIFDIQHKFEAVNAAISDILHPPEKEESDEFQIPTIHWEYEFPVDSGKFYWLPQAVSDDLEIALAESEETITRLFKPIFLPEPGEMKLLCLAGCMVDPGNMPYKLRRRQPFVQYMSPGIKPLATTTANLELTGKLPDHMYSNVITDIQRGICGGERVKY